MVTGLGWSSSSPAEHADQLTFLQGADHQEGKFLLGVVGHSLFYSTLWWKSSNAKISCLHLYPCSDAAASPVGRHPLPRRRVPQTEQHQTGPDTAGGCLTWSIPELLLRLPGLAVKGIWPLSSVDPGHSSVAHYNGHLIQGPGLALILS